MSAVLVETGSVIDELQPVSSRVGLKVGGRSPNESTGVGGLLNNGVQGDNIRGRATEEENGHSASSGRLEIKTIVSERKTYRRLQRSTYVPGDSVRASSRDQFVKTRLRNRVSLRSITNGSGPGGSERDQRGRDESEERGLHF